MTITQDEHRREIGRRALVQEARTFLRDVDAGEMPDADPEMVRLARVLDDNGDLFPPHVRELSRRLQDITRGKSDEDSTPIIAALERTQLERREAIDNAAVVHSEHAEA
jgi:hypothetical protein